MEQKQLAPVVNRSICKENIMSTRQQKTKQKRNTHKKETTLDLTYESVDEILQTSRSFGVLAYMGYKGIPISTDQKVVFRNPTIRYPF